MSRGARCATRGQRGEEGSGSVYVLTAAAVLLALGLGAAAVGDAVVARHRAQSVADLAALTAASAQVRGEDGCAAARVQVAAAGAVVTRCRAGPGGVVAVGVALPPGGVLGRFGVGPVFGLARAGPAGRG